MHKDRIHLYMFRNLLATCMIAIASFLLSLIHFYQCEFIEAMQRLFVYDIYTTLYFLLMWLGDYLIFEISKIIYDEYEKKVTFIPCLFLMVICVLVFYLPIHELFQYNLCLLGALILLRMIKQMYKQSPELFFWKRKKTKDGLK